jgi:hypothetical protein
LYVIDAIEGKGERAFLAKAKRMKKLYTFYILKPLKNSAM